MAAAGFFGANDRGQQAGGESEPEQDFGFHGFVDLVCLNLDSRPEGNGGPVILAVTMPPVLLTI
jgi:hypothetical protein